MINQYEIKKKTKKPPNIIGRLFLFHKPFRFNFSHICFYHSMEDKASDIFFLYGPSFYLFRHRLRKLQRCT